MEDAAQVPLYELIGVGFPPHLAPSIRQSLIDTGIARKDVPSATRSGFLHLKGSSLELWDAFQKLQARIKAESFPSGPPTRLSAASTAPIPPIISNEPNSSNALTPSATIATMDYSSPVPTNRFSSSAPSSSSSSLAPSFTPSLNETSPFRGARRAFPGDRELDTHPRSSKRNGEYAVTTRSSETDAVVERHRKECPSIEIFASSRWAASARPYEWPNDNPKTMLFSVLAKLGLPTPRYDWFVLTRNGTELFWKPWENKDKPRDEHIAYLKLSFCWSRQNPIELYSEACSDPSLCSLFLSIIALRYTLKWPRQLPPNSHPQQMLYAEGRLIQALPPFNAISGMNSLDTIAARLHPEQNQEYSTRRNRLIGSLFVHIEIEPRREEVYALFEKIPLFREYNLPSLSTQQTQPPPAAPTTPKQAPNPSPVPSIPATPAAVGSTLCWSDMLVPISKPIPKHQYADFAHPDLDRIEPLDSLDFNNYVEWRRRYADLDASPAKLTGEAKQILASLTGGDTLEAERLHFLFVIQKSVVCDALSADNFNGFFKLRDLLLGVIAHPLIVLKLANILTQCLALTPAAVPIIPTLLNAHFLSHIATLADWALVLPESMQFNLQSYLCRVALLGLKFVPYIDLLEAGYVKLYEALLKHADSISGHIPTWMGAAIRQLEKELSRADLVSDLLDISPAFSSPAAAAAPGVNDGPTSNTPQQPSNSAQIINAPVGAIRSDVSGKPLQCH